MSSQPLVEQNLQKAACHWPCREVVIYYTYNHNLDKLPTTGSRYRKILGGRHVE
jgi:hypothetical protein